MKKVLFLTLLVISNICFAAQYGLGASVKDYGSYGIYIPVNLSDNYRIEGSIYNNHFKHEDNNTTIPTNTSTEFDSAQIGIGFFKLIKKSSEISLSLGIRASYVKRKNNMHDSSTNTYLNDNADGYSVEPALGIEYYPIQNISLALEVSYYYTKLTGETTSNTSSINTETTQHGTNTNVILRYFFDE